MVNHPHRSQRQPKPGRTIPTVRVTLNNSAGALDHRVIAAPDGDQELGRLAKEAVVELVQDTDFLSDGDRIEIVDE